MRLTAGERLGHYEIHGLLGAGGMGEVYRATDTRLGREIALKVLPVEMAADHDRLMRFHREARAAAALNHPNIVTLHSAEEIDGIHFFTMELVDGRPLDELIPADGFPADRVVELATPLAEAIAAAHDKGLVHRDLKPANILVTSDRLVKVLDFGLAKDIHAVGQDGQTVTSHGRTQAGVIMGTPLYMSPEQISGAEVDHRTDVFSLGIILFEMLTGHRPFRGASQAELAAAILRDSPPRVTKPDAPSSLIALIDQCLVKAAGGRLQSARLLASALRDISRQPAVVSRGNADPRDHGFWVAVAPFHCRGADATLQTLAEGLTAEINAGLSRFSYLRVIAAGSSAKAARYVIDGGIRQAGSRLRVTVQLTDTITETQLWVETYERTFDPDTIFDIQDDLVLRIVSTCADPYGVIPRGIGDVVRGTDPALWSPYEALLHFFGYHQRLTAADHLAARSGLERAVEISPRNADCWAVLSLVYAHEYGHGFNAGPDPLERAQAAASRAVDLAPGNPLAHQAMSTVLLFLKEITASLHEADRAIALNPFDAGCHANMGANIAFAGDWVRGCALIERSMDLNPQHPVWYRGMLSVREYWSGNYQAAIDEAVKTNAPYLFWLQIVLAAAHGQLGERQAASAAVRALLTLVPSFSANPRAILNTWLQADLVEHLMQGLQKAGMSIAAELGGKSGSRPSIAVLPFTNMSADAENEHFCDGLAEELLNALSKIDDLKVAARTSAFSFKGKSVNVSEIGARLSVNHILEGSVRRSGTRLRISVQLVNASDGFHLWSESYDREMRDIFDIQDEIALAVVGALKVMLFGDEKAALLKRYTDDAAVHELFLKGRYYSYKYSAEGWTRAIEFYQRAIEIQPDHAPAHAGMAACYGCLWFFGLLPAGQTVPQCRAATHKALEVDQTLADAHLSLAIVTFFYDWEWERAEQAFRQSIALNANNAEALSYYALFLAFEGRTDEALDRARRALEIDPLSPLINMNVGWTYFSTGRPDGALNQAGKMIEIEPDFYGAYWLKGAIRLAEGRYPDAVEELKRAVSLGGHHIVVADLASAYGLAARREDATIILDRLLEMRRRQYVPAICLARVYSRLGETEKAIEWLETAFDERNGEMVFLQGEIAGAAADDPLNRLGSDPRLKDLLRRMNLPAMNDS